MKAGNYNNRLNAKNWYNELLNNGSRYSGFAYRLKRRGFTYVFIRDLFAGRGFK